MRIRTTLALALVLALASGCGDDQQSTKAPPKPPSLPKAPDAGSDDVTCAQLIGGPPIDDLDAAFRQTHLLLLTKDVYMLSEPERSAATREAQRKAPAFQAAVLAECRSRGDEEVWSIAREVYESGDFGPDDRR